MILPLVLLPLTVLAQVDYVSECPEDDGFFADALQCDRYYECDEGEVSEHFCPDGLVFDEKIDDRASCGFPFAIDCNGRNELQPAQPSPGCPRQHGYFAHPDPDVCDKFNFCVDGNPNTITCPGGLIFDPVKGQCAYSDQTDRKGCTSKELFQFRCPDASIVSVHEHSRHPDPEDCQFFYLCIEGRARRNGCSDGSVFDPVSLACQRQDKVEGPCQTWYNHTFIDSLNIPEQRGGRPVSAGSRTRPIAGGSRRRPAAPQTLTQNFSPRQQQLEPEEPLPAELAALAGFGQQRPAGRGSTSTNFGDGFGSFQGAPVQNSRRPVQSSTFERPPRPSQTLESRPAPQPQSSLDPQPARSNTGSGRGRVRQRQRGQVPKRTAPLRVENDETSVTGSERDSFFSSLRGAIGQGSRGRQEEQREERPSFSRPPPRRRPEPQQEPVEEATTSFGSFGSRQRQGSQSSRDNLLSQVEEEIARREQDTETRPRSPLSRGPQFSRGGPQRQSSGRRREEDQVLEEKTESFGSRRGVSRRRGTAASEEQTEAERYQAELDAELEVRRLDQIARRKAQEKYDADIAAELRAREEEAKRREAAAVLRAEAQTQYENEIAAELRARETEADRRKAELEVRRKDAVARAEAEDKYNAEIEAELEVRRKDALSRAKAKEKYDAEIAAELEIRRTDAITRAEAEDRYNTEIAANLRRQEEEEELRREAEGRRRPVARRREQEDSRRPSSGRLQVIESSLPALQKFDEDESEFARFNPSRQRNRG